MAFFRTKLASSKTAKLDEIDLAAALSRNNNLHLSNRNIVTLVKVMGGSTNTRPFVVHFTFSRRNYANK